MEYLVDCMRGRGMGHADTIHIYEYCRFQREFFFLYLNCDKKWLDCKELWLLSTDDTKHTVNAIGREHAMTKAF